MRAFPLLALALAAGAVSVAQAAPVTYQLDPTHTFVVLSWQHLGFSEPVAVAQISGGTLSFDAKDPAKSSLQVTLPLAKLDTFVPRLNEEFQSAQFFDTAKYPDATFKSTKVQALGGNRFRVIGELSVHGTTKPVTLDATLLKQGVNPMMKVQAIGFTATGTLKRSAFGVGAFVPYVSDSVSLRITTEGEVAKPATH